MAEAICDAVASSPYGLEVVCADNPSFPSPRTIDRWQDQHPEFCLSLTRAREQRADLLLDQSVSISDDGNADYRLELRRGDHVVVVDQEAIGRSRLRAETRLKVAAMLSPKKYGNKLDLHHSGSINFNDKSEDELVDMMREMITTGRVCLPDGYELVELAEEEDHSDLA